MHSKSKMSPLIALFSYTGEKISSVNEWRVKLLDKILKATFALWLVALIGGICNVFSEYQASGGEIQDPLSLVVPTILIYLLTTIIFTLITFNHTLRYGLRAGLLLFVLYILGTTGMVLTSFSGDGRIFFFAFIILSVVFFELPYSLVAFILAFLTLVVIGFLQLTGVVIVPPEWQVNAMQPRAWATGGIVLLFMSVAVFISVNYLIQAFEKSLSGTKEALTRELKMGQTLRIVSDINQLIVRTRDPNTLLNAICDHLILGRGYSFAWIGMLETDGSTLRLAAQSGAPTNFVSTKSRVTLDQGPACAAQAIRSRSFVRVDPASNIGELCMACLCRDIHPNASAVSLPILRFDRVFGVLVVDHKDSPAFFDEAETLFLHGLADDLAYALEHIEASEQLNINAQYQTLLNEVTQTALEAFDLDTLLQEFIRKLEKALGADGYYFALWDEARQIPAKFIFSENFRAVFSNLPNLQPDERIFSRSILEEGRVLAIPDTMNSPFISQSMAELFGMRSALGMPLVAENTRLGALVLGYRQVHVFTQEEVKLAEQAAQQFALAILKVKLNDEMRNKAAELERLYTASQDMVSSLLDPPSLLAKLAHHMAEALKVTSSTITSFNINEGSMRVVAEYWSDDAHPLERRSDLGRVYPLEEYDSIVTAMLKGEVSIIHDDDLGVTEAEHKQFAEYSVKSMMFVPILAHGQLLGTAELWESRTRREFSQADIKLAQAMSNYAASVIENSTLFTQTRQRENELAAMLKVAHAVSSSLQLSDVLKQAATELARLLRVDFCSLSDYLPERNGIVTTALFSADGDVSGQSDLGHYFSLDDYPTTLNVLLTGKPAVNHLNDPNTHPSEIAQLKHDGMFTSLVVPLRLRGQSLGLAELYSSDPERYFSSEEIQLVSALADQVAVAIENAWLYERSEQREAHFRALIENSAEGVAILDAEGIIRYVAPSEERLTGYTADEILGGSAFKYIHPEDLPKVLRTFREGIAISGAVRTIQYRLLTKSGEWRHFEITGYNMLHDPHIAGVVVNYRDITERKIAEKAIEDSEERYRLIFQSAGVPIWEDDYTVLMDALEELKEQGVADFNRYIADHPEFLEHAAQLITIINANDAVVDLMEANDQSELLGSLKDVLKEDPGDTFVNDIIALAEGKRHLEHESYLYTLKGNRRDIWVSVTFPDWSAGNNRVLVTMLDITERKRVERELIDNKSRLEGIINTALNAIITINEEQRIVLFNPFAEKIFGCSAEFALGKSIDIFIPERFRQYHHRNIEKFGVTNISNRVHGQMDTLRGVRVNGEEFPMEAFVSQQRLGKEKLYTVILRDITERKRAEDDQRRRAEELQTLAIVSSALRSASRFNEIIPLAVRYAVEIVFGDYGTIYMLDEKTGNLESPGWYSVEKGEDIRVTSEALLRHSLDMGITGHVAKTGEIYITKDLQTDPIAMILPEESAILSNARSGISLPLLSKEKVIGVLHIRLIKEHYFSETETRLLTAIAEMVGGALHRATLYEQTLRQADELIRAYDNTLSGWARALEMRDELTEGHTRRVTELTLELACAMNIPESEIIQIRRGAILHDIGKMGIPDSILNKPGPLAAHEQRIMQMHPQYAHEMLSSIPFLQNALDIPYCHHEWWDGNGYPRGLSGEEIPLSARIFSVVDVWDALTSDRPYRSAWAPERTLKYIRDGSGKQFDPRVVEAFLNLIENR